MGAESLGWVEAVQMAHEVYSPHDALVRRAVSAVKEIGQALLSTSASEPQLGQVVTELEGVARRLQAVPPTHGATAPDDADRLSRAANRNPHLGLHNYLAVPMRLWTGDDPTVLFASVTYAVCHAGPPGYAHGGQIAAFFDELLLSCQTLSGSGAATVELTVRYRKPVPIGVQVAGRAWTERIDGRKRRLRGEMTGQDGTVLAMAEGVAVTFRPNPSTSPTEA